MSTTWGDKTPLSTGRVVKVLPEYWDYGLVEHGDHGEWAIMRPASWVFDDAEPDTYYAGGAVWHRDRIMALKGAPNPEALLPPRSQLSDDPRGRVPATQSTTPAPTASPTTNVSATWVPPGATGTATTTAP